MKTIGSSPFLLVLLCASSGLAVCAFAAPASIHLEAENALLSGATAQTGRAGFSGTGYVSGFTRDGDKIIWTVPAARAGIYQARLRYSSPTGQKGTDLVVNGAKTSAMLGPSGEGFVSTSLGKIELRDGQNTVAIEKGWGYYDVDALDLVPSQVNGALPKPPATLVDPQATTQARALLSFLVAQYGRKTLSGQYEQSDTDFLRQTVQQTPAIRGGDLMDYSPSRLAHGSKPEGTSEKLIQAARDGQIITLSWHWNAPDQLRNASYTDASGKTIEAPWWRGFYSDATTFDLKAALADPQSNDYKLLLRDIDAIAVQLQKFSDARVPVLWRPLHEAEGTWFWWGASGPDSFKKLWRLMFERLTQKHGLHNLIWVYTAGNNPAWYPGDDVVDVVGADAYPSDASDPLSATWDDLSARFGGRKLLALTEFGHVPDVQKMRRFGVNWAYFVSWTGDLGPQPMPKEALARLYSAPSVLNQSGLALPLHLQETVFQPAPALASAPALALLAPTPANYRAIQRQAEENLRVHDLNQWFPRAVSGEFGGGFDQNFSENWTNTSHGERSLVYQSRLTWLAAQAALRFPGEAARWKSASTHGADFLRSQMWDGRNGGFFWELNAGTPGRNGEKHAYGNAFAIYALAAHFRATGDERSLQLAQNAFRWLDLHAHDARNGGYFEALSREGHPILTAPSSEQTADVIGTRYGYKSMNTHIHLLEAFAALSEIWPDPTLKSRLREVFGLVRDTIVVSPPGAMNLFFRPDWKPVPDHDSFGHDIETAYLLVEAAGALGMPNDKRTWDVARSLVDHTLDFGLDTQNGGFFDAGGTFGGISGDDKVWWAQAEALNALLLMHERFGVQTPRYWNAFVAQWNFIQTHQIDVTSGGWYRRVAKDNAPFAGESKSDGWTEGYHQGRALLNVSQRLAQLAARAPQHSP